jgi:antitoxin component HigA of HigAB toxin-antitoxin module
MVKARDKRNNRGPRSKTSRKLTPDPRPADRLVYDSLYKKFPLRPIRNQEDNLEAMQVAEELLDRMPELSHVERDYFEILGDLISKFESTEFADENQELPPHELFRTLIEAQGLRQADLAQELEIAPSRLSEFLRGKRKASRSLARKLTQRFSLSMETAFPELELNNPRVAEHADGIRYERMQPRDRHVMEQLKLMAAIVEQMSARLSKIEDYLYKTNAAHEAQPELKPGQRGRRREQRSL